MPVYFQLVCSFTYFNTCLTAVVTYGTTCDERRDAIYTCCSNSSPISKY